ncbi:cupin domain-containing protein [Thiomicrorhabdus sediminis]|uniref:Cupin n=1 Tax=Thiomicrorhabdus sediminis TaxID=2580412 RepID=A0A4P9K4L8_9GAMM|nr:cupin domain-containing protein [Thiomicrorhabdus sediminis]QCU89924.1 cupin [Thiomicrorhabdus sediminis]
MSKSDSEVNLAMDLAKKVVVHTADMPWQGSPSDGVLRKPLERENQESGRTTSIVQFMPGASFRPHAHPLGEEILVLEGVFSDESGDFPAGTYFRNPPGTSHQPFSEQGCTLLVKLDQFDPEDQEPVKVQTDFNPVSPGIGNLRVMGLHQFKTESCALVFWPAGEVFQAHRHWGGEEIFVIYGELIDEHGRYPQGTWLRSPHLSEHFPYVEQDTLIWVKTGHL